jgi:predicted DNA-binding ribbon-helix-helix protein
MIRKHSTTLHGHRTSFSLEDEFWAELTAIATTRAVPLAALISEIDDNRQADSNLSSALRLHVLAWLKSADTRSPADAPGD